MTTLIDIIGGRRVIYERGVTLCKGKLRSMTTILFPSFLRFWNRTFEAFSCLFVKHITTSRVERYLRILQLASTEEVNQFFFSCRIGCLSLPVELRLRSSLLEVFCIFRDVRCNTCFILVFGCQTLITFEPF
jgi:hypothetical protein